MQLQRMIWIKWRKSPWRYFDILTKNSCFVCSLNETRPSVKLVWNIRLFAHVLGLNWARRRAHQFTYSAKFFRLPSVIPPLCTTNGTSLASMMTTMNIEKKIPFRLCVDGDFQPECPVCAQVRWLWDCAPLCVNSAKSSQGVSRLSLATIVSLIQVSDTKTELATVFKFA